MSDALREFIDSMRYSEVKGELVHNDDPLNFGSFYEKSKNLPRIEKSGKLLELPLILLELPPDSDVLYNEKIYRASELKARLEGQIERQKRGRYKLWEAAEILVNGSQSTAGLNEKTDRIADRIASGMKEAFKRGSLRFYDSIGMPIDPSSHVENFLKYPDSTENFTTPDEVNAWLGRTGSPLRFPEFGEQAVHLAEGASGAVSPDNEAATAGAPAGMGHNTAGLPKQRAQERRILELLRSQGYDPLDLPPRPRGKAGTKAKIKKLALLETALFSVKTFDTAWQRLLDYGDVREGQGVSP